MKEKVYNCFQCGGSGKIFLRNGKYFDCDMCEGFGLMKGNNVLWKLQGEILQEWRLGQKLTLRKCAIRYNIDPSNLSKMERGVIKANSNYLQLATK